MNSITDSNLNVIQRKNPQNAIVPSVFSQQVTGEGKSNKRKRPPEIEDCKRLATAKKIALSIPINEITRTVAYAKEAELEKETNSSEKQKEAMLNLSLVDFSNECLITILMKLKFKDLAAFEQTCKAARPIVNYIWGIFRERDGLNFEFEIAKDRNNSDKYQLAYSVIEFLNFKHNEDKSKLFPDPSPVVLKHLVKKFEKIATIIALGLPPINDLCFIPPIYSDIANAAEKFAGEALLQAEVTPLMNLQEIFQHYVFACNNGVISASFLASERFRHFRQDIPQIVALTLLGADKGDFRALERLLAYKPDIIATLDIPRQNYPPVIAAKAKELHKKGRILAAANLFEFAMQEYHNAKSPIPLNLFIDAAEANSRIADDEHLQSAATLYNLAIKQSNDKKPIRKETLLNAALLNLKLNNVLRAAEIYELTREFTLASIQYEEFIRKANDKKQNVPDSVLVNAAASSFWAKNYKRASELFELRIKRSEEGSNSITGRVLENAAFSNYKAKNYKRAAELYELCFERFNEEKIPVQYATLGNAAYSNYVTGNFQRTASLFELFIKRHENEQITVAAGALENAAFVNYKIQNFQRAAELYELVIERYSNIKVLFAKEILANAAFSNHKSHNFPRAAELYELTFKRYKQEGVLITRIMFGTAALSNLKIKNFSRAAELYELAIKEYKDVKIPKELFSDAAFSNYKINNFLRAAELYELVIKRYNEEGLPLSIELLKKAVESNFNINNLQCAAALNDLLIKRYNEKGLLVPIERFTMAAEVNVMLNDFQKAADFNELIIIRYNDDNIPVPKVTLGNAALANYKAHNFQRAAELYELLISQHNRENIPILIGVLSNAAHASYKANNFKRAVEFYDLLIKQHHKENIPIPKAVLENAAHANYKDGNFKRSAKLFALAH